MHLVAKTHLDLGFTATAAEVTERYLAEFFPRAIDVAARLRSSGRPEWLVWTTGSWVLHRALCAGAPPQRQMIADAVRRGDLAWHALPVTTHTELMDAGLVQAGLSISAELDRRFDRTTTAAKMTDVPGHTRGLVSFLARAGVTFLHIGVNPAWPVPDVPPVFRWRAPDGAEVVVAYQAGGYGGEVSVPGCPEVLAFLHAGDNLGPPTLDEVVEAHAMLTHRYPGAEVRGSTLDAFARALMASGAAPALPLVTAEIGDPWLFGTGSDPLKVAAYRDLLARRRGLPTDGEESVRSRVDRTLLLVAEHTWGLDQKVALPDVTRWDRVGLAELRLTAEGNRIERSWAEQRAYVDEAAALLEAAGVELRDGALEPILGAETDGHVGYFASSVPRWPLGEDGTPRGGFVALAPGALVGGGGWQVGIDPHSGALAHLVHDASGRVLADADHLLGRLRYQSFDGFDYERFYAGLSPTPEDGWWARLDNTKPGIDAAGAVSGWFDPVVTGTWHASQHGGTWHTVLTRLAFRGVAADRLGAPAEVWSRWTWSLGGDGLNLDLWWVDKPANRLPEAVWCSFVPRVAEPHRWTLDKLGQAVSPLDVVRRGGRSLHAVGDGMAYHGPEGSLRIRTIDAPLVAPGQPNLLDADPPLPDLAGGFHVLLHDNLWGTNFPMWSEGPARFRFSVTT